MKMMEKKRGRSIERGNEKEEKRKEQLTPAFPAPVPTL